jgi:hypothetical protein
LLSLGAAVGSIITWKICKEKYEQIAQEEIASVKEVFSERLKKMNTSEPEETEIDDSDTDEEVAYIDIAKEYSTSSIENKDEKEKLMGNPYVISPDKFGEEEEYECLTYTYYADGILADGSEYVVEDVDGCVGRDSLRHFGENEDDADSVFVRNDKTKCYYEILRDFRRYTDIYGR